MRYVLFVCTHNAGRSQMAHRSRDAAARGLGVTLACGGVCPYVPSTVEDWDIPDPRGKTLVEVREIRDLIEARVSDLVEQRLDAVRADRSAHEFRLARLLPSLVEEFEGRRSPEEIRACANAVLADFEDVPVRSFVISLARRRASECLRADVCAALMA